MCFVSSKQGKDPKLGELVKSRLGDYLAAAFSEACDSLLRPCWGLTPLEFQPFTPLIYFAVSKCFLNLTV